MRAEELRIGNYVHEKHYGLRRVVALDIREGYSNVYRDAYGDAYGGFIKPIPLTEEWLKRFGFEYKGGEGYEAPTNTSFWYFSIKNGFIPSIWFDRTTPTDGYKGCNHVHQLQNLYHALTGEELEII